MEYINKMSSGQKETFCTAFFYSGKLPSTNFHHRINPYEREEMTMAPVISVNRLYISYYGNEAVHNVSFSIEAGNIVGIIGPNGAGKSTLLKSLLNLIPIDNGEVRIFGKPVKQVLKNIAYVPQRSDIDWNFPITVIDTVILGTYPHLGWFKRPNKQHKAWAYECLRKVGMEDYADRQIGELSGGQQQRVFLARALAQKAQLFLLDEPFVGIDAASEQTIMQILKKLKHDGKTIVVVHHDLSKADTYFDHLILINKELIEYGEVQTVFQPEVLSRAYMGQLSIFSKAGVSV
jgi:ABC-type Mn2+/Zn2+ transport system ATPase subunit